LVARAGKLALDVEQVVEEGVLDGLLAQGDTIFVDLRRGGAPTFGRLVTGGLMEWPLRLL
jgi:hypothetical protein